MRGRVTVSIHKISGNITAIHSIWMDTSTWSEDFQADQWYNNIRESASVAEDLPVCC